MDRLNTTLEDIGAEIGYTATTALVAWFGGGNLYVPETVSEMHPIAKAIGVRAAQRLVHEFGSTTLWIPDDAQGERERRDRLVAQLLGAGKGTKEIAQVTGLTERRVQQLRVRLEATGLIPYVLSQQKTRGESAQENGGAKIGGKNARQKAGVSAGGAA